VQAMEALYASMGGQDEAFGETFGAGSWLSEFVIRWDGLLRSQD